ncbi:MAG: hypothetical protein ACXVZR_12060 [Terriglobales bacterium]
MHSIQSLRPNVSRAAAVEQMGANGVLRLLRWATAGPLRFIAEVYVPFHLFRVTIDSGAGRQEKLLAIDAVSGNFDLYAFDEIPASEQLIRVSTRNRPAAVLDVGGARELLVERLRRLVFRVGFFRVRRLRIEAEPLDIELHVPYWVGLSGFGQRAHLTIIDGVRRRVEGGKIRAFFRQWLAS